MGNAGLIFSHLLLACFLLSIVKYYLDSPGIVELVFRGSLLFPLFVVDGIVVGRSRRYVSF